jgi:hypothetical protein
MVLALLLVGGFTTHVVYRAVWLPSSMSWPDETFSSERWKAAEEEKRFVFWKDLSRRRLMEGRTRAELYDLLGRPGWESREQVSYIVKLRDPREYTLNAIYFLRVHIDERDVVTRVSVGAD